MEYNKELPDYGDLITAKQYMKLVKFGVITDDNGFGRPVKAVDGKKMMADFAIGSDECEYIPDDATHVMWFNK